MAGPFWRSYEAQNKYQKKLDNDFESKFEDIFDKITEYGKKIHTKTKIKFIFLLQTATILN